MSPYTSDIRADSSEATSRYPRTTKVSAALALLAWLGIAATFAYAHQVSLQTNDPVPQVMVNTALIWFGSTALAVIGLIFGIVGAFRGGGKRALSLISLLANVAIVVILAAAVARVSTSLYFVFLPTHPQPR